MTIAEKLIRNKSDLDTISAEVGTQADLIAQIKNAAENLPEAGSGGSTGGSAEIDWIALWDEMLGDRDIEVSGGYHYDEETETGCSNMLSGALLREGLSKKVWIIPSGVTTEGQCRDYCDLCVIPRSCTLIRENSISNFVNGYSGEETNVLSLASNPPTLEWQGDWSVDGGMSPPTAIYVPDNAVDAYRTHPDWTEYAGIIQSISSFNYSDLGGN